MTPPACPKCDRPMEPGFLMDLNQGVPLCTRWVAGEARERRLLGVQVKGRRTSPVETYRCTGCGYLESYAREVQT